MSRREHDHTIRDLIKDREHQAYGLATGCGVIFLIFLAAILLLSN